MKSIFQSTQRSRRHRQAQTPENQQEQQHQPFFARVGQPNVQAKPQPFFQPKLAVGKPGDPYEREADAVADAVVNQQHSGKVTAGGGEVQRMPITPVTSSSLQRAATPDEEKMPGTNDARMAEDKKIQEKPIQKAEEEEEEPVQAQAEEEEKPVQAQAEEEEEPVQAMGEEEEMQAKEEEEEPLQAKSSTAPPHHRGASGRLSARLSQRRGSGNPLPKSVKTNMERSFGADFSGVRIHTDSEAVGMNRDLHAQAFTHGQDVYFNSGKFNPEQTEGKRLLAHELTHVVQQTGQLNRKETESSKNDGRSPIETLSEIMKKGDEMIPTEAWIAKEILFSISDEEFKFVLELLTENGYIDIIDKNLKEIGEDSIVSGITKEVVIPATLFEPAPNTIDDDFKYANEILNKHGIEVEKGDLQIIPEEETRKIIGDDLHADYFKLINDIPKIEVVNRESGRITAYWAPHLLGAHGSSSARKGIILIDANDHPDFVFAHEIGHALGLDHKKSKQNLMGEQVDPKGKKRLTKRQIKKMKKSLYLEFGKKGIQTSSKEYSP